MISSNTYPIVFTFLHHGFPVVAVDGCDVAIADNQTLYAKQQPKGAGSFHALDFTELAKLVELEQLASLHALRALVVARIVVKK